MFKLNAYLYRPVCFLLYPTKTLKVYKMFKSPFILVHFVYFTCWYFLLHLLILLTSPVDTFYFTCWYFLLHLLIRFTSFSGFFLNSESSAFPYLFHQIFFFSFSKYAEHWTLNCKAIWNMNTRKQLGKQIFLNKIVAYL